MKQTDNITELAIALHNFHGEIKKILKEASNPFFKSKYASLPNILDAISEPLHKSGLILMQFPCDNHGLTTRVMHTSGQWIEDTYFMPPVKATPQDAGSAITYQRRYAIGAVLSLNIDEDDDGNKASGNGNNRQTSAPVAKTETPNPVKKPATPQQITEIELLLTNAAFTEDERNAGEAFAKTATSDNADKFLAKIRKKISDFDSVNGHNQEQNNQ